MLLQSGLSLKKQHEMNFKLVPHVTFKIINENEEYWESPYFYTHAQGYKICFDVEFEDDDPKKHLSLYCYIASGIYDDSLAWPFQGEVNRLSANSQPDLGFWPSFKESWLGW